MNWEMHSVFNNFTPCVVQLCKLELPVPVNSEGCKQIEWASEMYEQNDQFFLTLINHMLKTESQLFPRLRQQLQNDKNWHIIWYYCIKLKQWLVLSIYKRTSTIMSKFVCIHDFMLWIIMVLLCEWISSLCPHYVDTDLLQCHRYQSHRPLQRISRWNTTKSLPCLHDRRIRCKDEGDKGWCSSCYSLLLRIIFHENWPVDFCSFVRSLCFTDWDWEALGSTNVSKTK